MGIEECHNLKYGRYCIDAVCSYYHDNGRWADILVAKKIFVDRYNTALEWDTFKQTGCLRKQLWTYPPLCLRMNSMDMIIQWMEWKKGGEFISRGQVIPPFFYEF